MVPVTRLVSLPCAFMAEQLLLMFCDAKVGQSERNAKKKANNLIKEVTNYRELIMNFITNWRYAQFF